MKIFLIALAVLGIALHGHPQVKNIALSDVMKFEKVYAGFDTKLTLPNDNLYPLSMTSLRLGTAINWTLTNVFSVYAHGAIQGSSTHKSFAIAAVVLYVKLTQRLQLGMGLPPTATTFTRPHPITWQSQTESYAQSRIPGNKPGLILQYLFTKHLKMAYSLQNLNGRMWSNYFNVTYRQFSITGFVHQDKELFVSIRLNTSKIDANFNYSSLHQEYASSIFLNLNEKITVYGDANYLQNEQKTNVTNFGIRRHFYNNRYHTGGFLSLSHDISKRLTAIHLFLYLK